MKTGDGDSSGIPSNVPAFLVKLWKLVEDPQYEEHISWNKVNNLSFTTFASRQITWLIYYRYLPDVFEISTLNPFSSIIEARKDDFDLSTFFPCRMGADFWCTIKPRLHARYFLSILNTTTLQASSAS